MDLSGYTRGSDSGGEGSGVDPYAFDLDEGGGAGSRRGGPWAASSSREAPRRGASGRAGRLSDVPSGSGGVGCAPRNRRSSEGDGVGDTRSRSRTPSTASAEGRDGSARHGADAAGTPSRAGVSSERLAAMRARLHSRHGGGARTGGIGAHGGSEGAPFTTTSAAVGGGASARTSIEQRVAARLAALDAERARATAAAEAAAMGSPGRGGTSSAGHPGVDAPTSGQRIHSSTGGAASVDEPDLDVSSLDVTPADFVTRITAATEAGRAPVSTTAAAASVDADARRDVVPAPVASVREDVDEGVVDEDTWAMPSTSTAGAEEDAPAPRAATRAEEQDYAEESFEETVESGAGVLSGGVAPLQAATNWTAGDLASLKVADLAALLRAPLPSDNVAPVVSGSPVQGVTTPPAARESPSACPAPTPPSVPLFVDTVVAPRDNLRGGENVTSTASSTPMVGAVEPTHDALAQHSAPIPAQLPPVHVIPAPPHEVASGPVSAAAPASLSAMPPAHPSAAPATARPTQDVAAGLAAANAARAQAALNVAMRAAAAAALSRTLHAVTTDRRAAVERSRSRSQERPGVANDGSSASHTQHQWQALLLGSATMDMAPGDGAAGSGVHVRFAGPHPEPAEAALLSETLLVEGEGQEDVGPVAVFSAVQALTASPTAIAHTTHAPLTTTAIRGAVHEAAFRMAPPTTRSPRVSTAVIAPTKRSPVRVTGGSAPVATAPPSTLPSLVGDDGAAADATPPKRARGPVGRSVTNRVDGEGGVAAPTTCLDISTTNAIIADAVAARFAAEQRVEALERELSTARAALVAPAGAPTTPARLVQGGGLSPPPAAPDSHATSHRQAPVDTTANSSAPSPSSPRTSLPPVRQVEIPTTTTSSDTPRSPTHAAGASASPRPAPSRDDAPLPAHHARALDATASGGASTTLPPPTLTNLKGALAQVAVVRASDGPGVTRRSGARQGGLIPPAPADTVFLTSLTAAVTTEASKCYVPYTVAQAMVADLEAQERMLRGYHADNESLRQQLKNAAAGATMATPEGSTPTAALPTGHTLAREAPTIAAALRSELDTASKLNLAMEQLEAVMVQHRQREAELKAELDAARRACHEWECKAAGVDMVAITAAAKEESALVRQLKLQASEQRAAYDATVADLTAKVEWYRENQRIIEADAATIAAQAITIRDLQSRLAKAGVKEVAPSGDGTGTTSSGSAPTTAPSPPKPGLARELARAQGRIVELERQVDALDEALRKRHPDSLAVLIHEAKGAPHAGGEQEALVAEVSKLRQQAIAMEEAHDRKLRALRIEFERLQAETKATAAGRPCPPPPPTTSTSLPPHERSELVSLRVRVKELEAEVSRVRSFYQGKVRDAKVAAVSSATTATAAAAGARKASPRPVRNAPSGPPPPRSAKPGGSGTGTQPRPAAATVGRVGLVGKTRGKPVTTAGPPVTLVGSGVSSITATTVGDGMLDVTAGAVAPTTTVTDSGSTITALTATVTALRQQVDALSGQLQLATDAKSAAQSAATDAATQLAAAMAEGAALRQQMTDLQARMAAAAAATAVAPPPPPAAGREDPRVATLLSRLDELERRLEARERELTSAQAALASSRSLVHETVERQFAAALRRKDDALTAAQAELHTLRTALSRLLPSGSRDVPSAAPPNVGAW